MIPRASRNTVLSIFAVTVMVGASLLLGTTTAQVDDGLETAFTMVNKTMGDAVAGAIDPDSGIVNEIDGNVLDFDQDGYVDVIGLTDISGEQLYCVPIQVDYLYTPSSGSGWDMEQPGQAQTGKIMIYSLLPDIALCSDWDGGWAIGNEVFTPIVVHGQLESNPAGVCNIGPSKTPASETGPCSTARITVAHDNEDFVTEVNNYNWNGFIPQGEDFHVAFEQWARTQAGSLNRGEHMVLRTNAMSGTAYSRTANTEFQFFTLDLDLENLHLVSGQTVSATKLHDFDDDGAGDTEEIQSGSNPFNWRSLPQDLDGDGVGNAADKYDSDPNRDHDFPFAIALTQIVSTAGATRHSQIPLSWTVTPIPGAPAYSITHFDIWAYGRDGSGNPVDPFLVKAGLPSNARSYNWEADMQAESLDLGFSFGSRYFIVIRGYDSATPAASGQSPHIRDITLIRPPVAHDVTDANGNMDFSAILAGDVKVTVTPNARQVVGAPYRVIMTHPSDCGVTGTYVETGTVPGTSAFEVIITSVEYRSVFGGNLDRNRDCSSSAGDENNVNIAVEIDETGKVFHRTSKTVKIRNNALATFGADSSRQTDLGGQTASAPQALPPGGEVLFRIAVRDADGSCAAGAPKSVTVTVYKDGVPVVSDEPLSEPLNGNVGFVCQPSIDPAVPNGGMNYANGVTWYAYVSGLEPGVYTYNFKLIDADGNRRDNAVPPGFGPATVSSTFTITVMDDALESVQAIVIAALGCEPGTSLEDCANEVGDERVNEIVSEIEDNAECDVAGFGNEDHEVDCSEKPGETVNGILEVVGGIATDTIEEVTEAVQDAADEGLPNPYGPANCEIFVGAPPEPVCPEGDTDEDGYTDAQEEGVSDPHNPFSNPLDRDADLLSDVLEVFLEVHLYRIDWTDADGEKPCINATEECSGRVVPLPAPEKHATIWRASGFTEDRRHSTLLTVTETSEGFVRVTSESGGQAGYFQWTVAGGLQQVSLEGGSIYVLVNAEDNERAAEILIAPENMGVADTSVVSLSVLGGDRATASRRAPATGNTFVQESNLMATLEVESNPLDLIVNGVSMYNPSTKPVSGYVATSNLASNSGAVVHGNLRDPTEVDGFTCMDKTKWPPAWWIHTERDASNNWVLCARIEAPNQAAAARDIGPQTLPAGLSAVGLALVDGELVVWADQDDDYMYDSGEELGGVPPPPPIDPGVCGSTPVDECVQEQAKEILCGDGSMTPEECLAELIGDGVPLDQVDALVRALTECDAEVPLAQCVSDFASETGNDVLGQVGPVEDAVRDTLECDDLQSTADCAVEAVSGIGGTAIDTVTEVAGMLTGAIGTITAIVDGIIADAVPTVMDTDGDGYNNDHEAFSGTNPFHANSNPRHPGGGFPWDWDGDGYNNDHEALSGGDPLHECSTPKNAQGPVTGC